VIAVKPPQYATSRKCKLAVVHQHKFQLSVSCQTQLQSFILLPYL